MTGIFSPRQRVKNHYIEFDAPSGGKDACHILILIALVCHGCSHGNSTVPPPPPSSQQPLLVEEIRNRLARTGIPFRVKIAGETIRAAHSLPRFYQLRSYESAWMKGWMKEGIKEFKPLARVHTLMQQIKDSKTYGLKPNDFHQEALQTLLEDLDRRRKLGIEITPDRLVDLDFLLTDAYLTFSNQLQSGKIKPKIPGYEWYIPQNDHVDLVPLLQRAISTVPDTILETLLALQSSQPEYWRLREALAEYRKIAKKGGWRIVTPGSALRRGASDRRVRMLRNRLTVTYDLAPVLLKNPPMKNQPSKDARLFDERLEVALKKFQHRHGLRDDGVLGKSTVDALNVSALARVRQLELNLERWRWLPHALGRRYIAVNIASFELRVVENNKTVLNMPVVIGNQYRHTPVFTGIMTHLVINPSWFVPTKIAVEDLLPKIKQQLKQHPDDIQSNYLKDHGFTVLRKDPIAGFVEVDASQVDWKKLDDENFDYTLRQNPGPTNALGRVKFVFPNKFNIYLHDTPSKDLFTKRVRNFSSGCIRIQKPVELMKYVLMRSHDLTENYTEKRIDLPEALPVHILYQTAWVDESGAIHFRPDIYGQDELLNQYL